MMLVSSEAHFQWLCTRGQGAVTLVDNPSEAGFSSGTLTLHSLDGCVFVGVGVMVCWQVTQQIQMTEHKPHLS